jgi:uncharacterized protein with HEPN domain
MKVDYAITRDKLASKFKELDDAVIWEQAEVKLVDAEKRLTTAESEKKG